MIFIEVIILFHLLDFQKTASQTLIVLEYCKFGTLSSHYGQNKLGTTMKKLIALDCAKGMRVGYFKLKHF